MTRWVLGAFARPSTYRRWAYFVLGGALASPYVLFGAILVPSVVPAASTLPGAVAIGGACMVLALVGTAFLPAVRALEFAAVRELLDDPVPDAAGAASGRARVRAAALFTAHVLVGGVVSVVSLLLPIAFAVAVSVPFTGGFTLGEQNRITVPTGWASAWLPAAGVSALLALVPVVAGLGGAFRRLATVLLGLRAADRIARLERQTERLLERARLARELHDSVGHALSVVSIQAGAARRLLSRDPAAADGSMAAVQDAARAALDDLDHVLGLLREDGAAGTTPPRAGLPELPSLLSATRLAGVGVSADIQGDLAAVAPVVSREAYRLVQESLTNAVRHAGKVPVTVRVVVTQTTLEITVGNPATGAGGTGRGGRGLRGMRERVDLLGGTLRAGRDGERWVVAATLPTGRATP
ncbi:sensor histidine kinase [Saccharomonospora piscinae]|uniref:sensor histidine kinase n=1 Tax=Saccharomonospora piscinae TaxID=687388 RepID=UPI0011063C33|nr:histidine kinase [Saccharomonospora piscinae]TLW94880.1 sensor histidine kinase [Saccharomonospora piscinae]